MGWYHRVRSIFGHGQLEQQIDDELAFHVAERTDELIAQGMTESEARRRAGAQFGNYTRQKEETREAHLWNWLDGAVQDLRYAFRTLAANPAFAATAVLSLALGIGANTAIFSIINAVMLRSLPVEDPARLVQIRSKEVGVAFTNPTWEQVRDHQKAFSGALAYSVDRFDIAGGGESRFTQGLWVSGDFFRVLGVPALSGRLFSTEQDRRGTAPVAVVSYGFQKRHFSGDSSVVGKTISLNRHKFEIIGVTPPWFKGLDVDQPYDVAIPIACEPILHTDYSDLDNRSAWWLRMLGRLAPGETLKQADDAVRAMAPGVYRATVALDWPAQQQKEFVQSSFSLKPAATGFSEIRVQYGTALFTLMVTVGLVLLITCANIANLLLSRATARQRELSVRMAMGATRSRVIRQLMTESLLISLVGTAVGFLLALWGSRALAGLISTTGDHVELNLTPDLHLLAFTAGAAVVTALLFGFAPALRATRDGVNHALKESARGTIRGASRFNLGKTLVAGQVALSLILLVAASLFLGTLRNLLTVDPGFSYRNVLLVNADFQQTSIKKQARNRTYGEILERLRAIPGVSSAAASMRTPISNRGMDDLIYVAGYRPKSRMDNLVWLNLVSPRYFATISMPLLMGRDFSEHDDLESPKAIVIDESTARRFFDSANPIGKKIEMDKPGAGGLRDVYHVIGVVKDAKYQRINEEPRLTAYLAAAQEANSSPLISFEIRSTGSVNSLTPTVRSAIQGVNHDVSLEFRNFETQVNESLLQPRIVALLSSLFGLLALLLAGIGLYGITTYGVSRRKNEIGIRIALGADRGSVVWLIMRNIIVLLGIGLLVGLTGSLMAGRLVRSLLYGIQPNDPAYLAGAAVLLALCTVIAAFVPARRASRLDPMEALREE